MTQSSEVVKAFEKMGKHNVGRLLVVDEKDERSLLGILTRSDAMYALRKNLKLEQRRSTM